MTWKFSSASAKGPRPAPAGSFPPSATPVFWSALPALLLPPACVCVCVCVCVCATHTHTRREERDTQRHRHADAHIHTHIGAPGLLDRDRHVHANVHRPLPRPPVRQQAGVPSGTICLSACAGKGTCVRVVKHGVRVIGSECLRTPVWIGAASALCVCVQTTCALVRFTCGRVVKQAL